jgi:hypothetical protein
VLTDGWKGEIQRCAAEDVVQRLWKRDSSLWPAAEHELPLVKSNMQWLDLPEQIERYVSHVVERAKVAEQEGLGHFVFVAMSTSNLAVATILNLPKEGPGKKNLSVGHHGSSGAS